MDTSNRRGQVIMAKFIRHEECEECNSSDANSLYLDENGNYYTHCYSCDTTKQKGDDVNEGSTQEKIVPFNSRDRAPATGREPTTLMDRKLSKSTLEKYEVTLGYDNKNEVVTHYYPYFKEGVHIATKERKVDTKEFMSTGIIGQAELFGQKLVKEGGQYITITEGEIDAMSVYEMTTFPAVSVKGASSALTDCKKQIRYLDSFDSIVIAFDKDKAKLRNDGTEFFPGQEAAEKVAKLFKPGKVLIMDMGEFKDANDWLKAGKGDEFKRQWWRAKPYTPDSIINSANVWDIIMKDDKKQSVPYQFDGLNQKTYGLRTSELVTVTAGTGIGKSTFCKHTAVHLMNNIPEDENIGMLMIEESTRETALSLMSMHAKKAFHLPDTKATPDELRKAYEDVLGTGRFYIQADKIFAWSDIDGIVNTITYLANGLNCKYIVLDHISIITSSQENGDERRALDSIMTRLKALTMQLDICLIVVCHLKRLSGTPAEEGAQITINDLRGTQGIGQLSNIILALERNGQSEDADEANTINIRVLKNRYCGRLGVACQVQYDEKTVDFIEKQEYNEEDYGGKYNG